MWFIFAFTTMVAWGFADLFYKKGADRKDPYSHLKTAMMVGFIMGAHAIYVLLFDNIDYDFSNILVYAPVSAMYILSMTVGYFGLRYLELSISSPIQNASGAVVAVMCMVFLGQTLDFVSGLAVVLICSGVFSLGVFEKHSITQAQKAGNEKYTRSFIAFLIPVLYCIIDSLGTFFDAYYLDDVTQTPLRNVTEDTFEMVANTSYELTFLLCAIAIFIFLKVVKKEKIGIMEQKDRGIAAVFETIGQFAYVFALSGNGVVAAPMVAAYCIVSLILSRIVIKERLEKKQYISIVLVVVGIIIMGIMEGLETV